MAKKNSIELKTKLDIIAYSDSHHTESKVAIAKFFNVNKRGIQNPLTT